MAKKIAKKKNVTGFRECKLLDIATDIIVPEFEETLCKIGERTDLDTIEIEWDDKVLRFDYDPSAYIDINEKEGYFDVAFRFFNFRNH